jgi:hypothetical protein
LLYLTNPLHLGQLTGLILLFDLKMGLVMLDALVERLHVIETGLEEIAIIGVAIRGDALEQNGVAVLETVADYGQSIFQVHRNYICSMVHLFPCSGGSSIS